MNDYDHKAIEAKWQKRWAEQGLYRADDASKKPKVYILDMFPYPSGTGLHVGHVEGYTATDIYSRYKRMQGFNVLHPMGWDAFGLPAENYAIKTGTPPQETTDNAIKNFTRQIKSLGLSYDWSREIGTHRPEYYQWTQWFFLFLYQQGLAEKKRAKVNWCPKDQTVLANEQVVDGCCERCGTPVIQKDLEQWFFKTTAFADALYDDLDQVDWPASTKTNQRNWIGRSEGAEIDFKLSKSDFNITVFTTRADTLFGATYVVLAPEHPLIQTLAFENKTEVQGYLTKALNKTNLERTENKEKTGVELKGVKAINPATKEQIPIWIADYVIGSYGTGAVMAVPAHDERDHEFAKKYSLPIKDVISRKYVLTGEDAERADVETLNRRVIDPIIHDDAGNFYLIKEPNGSIHFAGGGVDEGEDDLLTVRREVTEGTGFVDFEIGRRIGPAITCWGFRHTKMKNQRTIGYAYEVILTSPKRIPSEVEEGRHELIKASKGEALKMISWEHHRYLLERYLEGDSAYDGEGVLMNSAQFDGIPNQEAKAKITEKVEGQAKTTYKLRDWLVSRQRYWGAPIPIVYDPQGKPHPVPEKNLPWLLPTDVEFKPTGVSPLGQSKELLERTEKIFGKGWRPEVDTLDTFVCSSWYFFRFADPHNVDAFASVEAIKKWLPVDLYMGGAEHTVLHLMYARFFTKALQKAGLISFGEPFMKLRHQGTILAEDGTKMSKSKGNVVNPDDVVLAFGADSLRVYEMFMGPLEAMKPWNTNNIMGARRFIERVWRLADKIAEDSRETETTLHQTIRKVGEDIESFSLNTAISQMMIFINTAEKSGIGKGQFESFLKLLSPFAPHVADELWERLGHTTSLHEEAWPAYDPSQMLSDSVTIAVQVGGKTRGTVEVARGVSQEEALSTAQKDAKISKYIDFKPQKIIFVPDRILNLIP